MAYIKDFDIKNMKDGDVKAERLGHGNGAMVFQKVGETNSCYYRYWQGRRKIQIKLGTYQQTPKSPGMKTPELRDKALEMAALRKEVAPLDLKEYLQDRDAEKLRQVEERKREQTKVASVGTFEELLSAYAKSLEDRKASCAYSVGLMFESNVLIPYPDIAGKPAGEVTSEDLMPILSSLIKRNSPGQYNGVRSYLSAAFNFGVRADFNPRENARTGKRYRIKSNPVTPFPKEATQARRRVLSHQELRQLWRDIDDGIFDDIPQYGLFVQFCLACFGNRPAQLVRVKWSDVDLDKRTLTFIDVKGRGKPRITVIPLTERAMTILNRIKQLSFNYRFNGRPVIPEDERTVFTNESGEPLGYDSVYDKISRYTRFCRILDQREAQKEGREYKPEEHWTMKDFRRTAVGIMTDSRIIRESRYLLQSRTDGSIESRHYDVSDRLDEKREAAAKYDAMLEETLQGETIPRETSPCQVVCDPVTEDYQTFKRRILDNGEVMTQKYYVRNGYKESVIRKWFDHLVLEGVIKKVFERYVLNEGHDPLSTASEIIDNLPDDGYKLFRQRVLDSGELKQQKQYVQEGYSYKRVSRWFKRLVAEGFIEKVHRMYYLKPTN